MAASRNESVDRKTASTLLRVPAPAFVAFASDGACEIRSPTLVKWMWWTSGTFTTSLSPGPRERRRVKSGAMNGSASS